MKSTTGGKFANYRRALVAVSLGMTAILMMGCGSQGDRPDLGRVVGTVTLDGQPLANAWVLFSPQGFRSSRGVTDAQGRYELTYLRDIKGAVIGQHLVTFGMMAASETDTVKKLPARYDSESTLEREVTAGDNTIDFALESDPQ